jgi:hypothetical protein
MSIRRFVLLTWNSTTFIKPPFTTVIVRIWELIACFYSKGKVRIWTTLAGVRGEV